MSKILVINQETGEQSIVEVEDDFRPLHIPQSVTPRQARLALFAVGKAGLVEAAIEGLPEPQRTAAKIEWDYATEVRRSSPLISGLAPALDMTDGDIDDLFILASTIA